MADNPLSSGSIMRPYRSNFGSHPIRTFQASTAVSTARITRGDLVHFDQLVETGSFRIRRDLIASTVYSTGLIGVAIESDTFSDAAGTGLSTTVGVGSRPLVTNLLQVALASPITTEFEVWCGDVIASTWINRPKALVRDSTLNVWKMDSTNSTVRDQRVVVTELLDTPGDTGGRIVVRFLPRPLSLDSTTSTSGSFLALGQ